MSKIWIVATAAVALAGCAVDGGNGGGRSTLATGQCFRGEDVNNFNVKDEQTVYVSTRQGYVFRLEAPQGCFARGTESLSVSPFTGADPRVCVGEQANVSVSRFRAPALPCIAQVAGPIRDSRESGLRSRQD